MTTTTTVHNWLLLRGLAREQAHWGSFGEQLSRSLPDHRVHYLDLAGSGTELRRPAYTSVDENVADLRVRWQVLQRRSSGPWSLMTISLGGMVGLQWTASHPEDFQQHVVMSTSASDLGPVWQRLRPGGMNAVLRALVASTPHAREQWVVDATTQLVEDRPALVQQWAEIARQRPMRVAAVLRQLLAGVRFRLPESIAVPTLALVGAADQLVDPGCTHKLAARYDFELREHPTAGHDLSRDAPRWVCRELAEWLAQ